MNHFSALKSKVVPSLAATALAFSGIGIVHAQGTAPGQGAPGAQTGTPGQYDKSQGGKRQGYDKKGERSKKNTDMDRRGDDSSSDYGSGNGSGSSSGSGSGSSGAGSYESGSGGASGGGGSKY
jgi:hypothetical protein